MDQFDYLKNIWQQGDQQTVHLDLSAIMQQAAKHQQKLKRQTWAGIIFLAATIIFQVFLSLYFQFPHWSTRLGIILMVSAMTAWIALGLKSILLLRNEPSMTVNVQEYLQGLIEFRKKQQYLQTTGFFLYSALLSLGLGLYLWVFLLQMSTFWAVFTVGLTVCWMLFASTILRKKVAAQQEKKTNELIKNLQKVAGQLETD